MAGKQDPFQKDAKAPSAPLDNTYNQYPPYPHHNLGPPPPYDAGVRPEYRFPPSYDQSISQQNPMNMPQQMYVPPQNQNTVYMHQNVAYNQNYVQQPSGMTPVLEFDSAARFNGKGAGSITVPPPPPGYAPTPAQLAALQGQPVVVTKKKRSFF